jgi:hypothetical protein
MATTAATSSGVRGRGARLDVGEFSGLGGRLTALAGASRWLLGGVIAYDNAVKQSLLDALLDVPEHALGPCRWSARCKRRLGGRLGARAVDVDKEMRVLDEERLLRLSLATVDAVSVRVRQLADREAVRSLLG